MPDRALLASLLTTFPAWCVGAYQIGIKAKLTTQQLATQNTKSETMSESAGRSSGLAHRCRATHSCKLISEICFQVHPHRRCHCLLHRQTAHNMQCQSSRELQAPWQSPLCQEALEGLLSVTGVFLLHSAARADSEMTLVRASHLNADGVLVYQRSLGSR